MNPPAPVWWLYGRSGAGKTTLALLLAARLRQQGVPVLLLDGDILRAGLCRSLGFDPAARAENHRRMAEVARIASEQGLVVLCASMAPSHDHRRVAREILGGSLRWAYLDAPWDVCRGRDPKGLFRRAAAGDLATPLAIPFDEPGPDEADVVVPTGHADVSTCLALLVEGWERPGS